MRLRVVMLLGQALDSDHKGLITWFDLYLYFSLDFGLLRVSNCSRVIRINLGGLRDDSTPSRGVVHLGMVEMIQ
ncbi:hypothetical protein CARUB_v10015036mg [Capsella rubella]|uniref:Uncharacterized protein n=1 Tax=Capsella rubella TaxID=81985 RepID=R0I5Z5_9BRAS|nr:hypothetical protein CARUB_v10015036mg [Capsella rubella]